MDEPIWLSRLVADSIHMQAIREHGGSPGVRDDGLIESALARPQQKWSSGGDDVDLPELAAAYAFGLARNHGYVDGNKRVAFGSMAVFLVLNGLHLTAPEPEAFAVMVDLASGELSEGDFARWLRASTERLG